MEKRMIHGEEVSCYPLTTVQSVLYNVFLAYASLNEMNLGVGCYYKMEADIEKLKEAIETACGQYECMRVRFTKGKDGKMYQYIWPKPWKEHIPVLDFEIASVEEVKEKLTAITSKEVNYDNVTMNQFAIVKLADGYSGIYMKVNHMLMDSCSIISFLSRLFTIYFSLINGKPVETGIIGDYTKMIEKELSYIGSRAEERDEAYWRAKITESEPIYTHYAYGNPLYKERLQFNNPNLRKAATLDVDTASDITTYIMPAEESNKYITFCKDNKINMASFVTLALRTAISSMNENEEDISMRFMVNRRGSQNEKISGGNRMTFHYFRTKIPKEMPVKDALKTMEQKQTELYLHANYNVLKFIGYRKQYYHMEKEETYESIGLTYQPMSAEIPKEFSLPPCKSVWYGNGTCSHNVYLTIKHRFGDNALEFTYEYRKYVVTKQELEQLYKKVWEAMEELKNNLDNTMDKVLDNMAELVLSKG